MKKDQTETKTSGRPKVLESQKRINTNVWLRKSDYDNLRDKAKSVGITYSSYCEKVLLNKTPKFQTGDHALLRGEIRRIGNNINQIAKKLNHSGVMANRDLQHFNKKAVDSLQAIIDLIDELN